MDGLTEPAAVPAHLRALGRANAVRHARAELKRDVSLGLIDIGGLILACPWEARTMTVADLLTTQPGWGAVRTRKLLSRLNISELRSIEALTQRQCHAISDLLPDPASRERRTRRASGAILS
jgi:hypothetical protein